MTDPTPAATQRLYERRLPSGGYIAIQVTTVRTLFGPNKLRGEIVVERRPEARREGHRPPIAACAENSAVKAIVDALYPLATSDPAIAEVLQRGVMITIAPGKPKPIS